jgi:hypothetical protein
MAVDGQVQPAEVVAGEADAVPGGRLAAPVAELLEQGQGLPAVEQCPVVVPEQGEAVADTVQRLGRAETVPGGPEQLECPLGLAERVRVAARLDEPFGADGPVGPQQQRGRAAPLPGTADVDHRPAGPDLDRSQDAVLHAGTSDTRPIRHRCGRFVA